MKHEIDFQDVWHHQLKVQYLLATSRNSRRRQSYAWWWTPCEGAQVVPVDGRWSLSMLDEANPKSFWKKHVIALQGSLNYPFGGNETPQMYGHFEGFPFNSALSGLVM